MATTMIISIICVIAFSSAAQAAPKEDQQLSAVTPEAIASLAGGSPSVPATTPVEKKKEPDEKQPDIPVVPKDEQEPILEERVTPDLADSEGAISAESQGDSSSDLDTANTFWGGYGGYGRWGGWGGYYRPYYGGWGGGWRRHYGWGRGWGYGGYPYWG